MDKKTRTKSVILLVALLALLTYLLPTDKVVKYDFIVGQKWDKPTLTAPFDFPIYKTDREYLSEVDGYEETFVPVYKLDPSVEGAMLDAVSSDFNVERDTVAANDAQGVFLKTEKQRLARNLKPILTEMYDNGIISVVQDGLGERDVIRVLDGDELSMKLVNNYYSVESARLNMARKLAEKGYDSTYIADNSLNKYVRANITYDSDLNRQMLEESIKKISTTKGFITEGTVIVSEGDIVSPKIAKTLEDLNKEYSILGAQRFSVLPYIGNFLYIALIILISCFTLFLQFTKEPLRFNGMLFMAMLYALMAFLCSVVSKFPMVSIYVVPFAIVPFYLSEFFNSRIAVMQYIFVLLICAVYSSVPFEFISYNLVAGIAGMYFLRKSYRRNAIFLAVLITFASYVVIYLAFTFMRQQHLGMSDLYMVMWFAINAVLLLALLQLTFVFEKLFKFVTKITLVELTDTNQKLLKDLSEKAPGTFQHILQVANIVEEATNAIGGNALLARAGVMYHDIGKMMNPAAFIENQRSDESVHDKLSPKESAKLINRHVTDGVALAKKYNIPQIVADFIPTHHGDSLIRFFYRKEVDSVGAENADITKFKYIGPPPFTKEQTILMIADAVEAASRTLKVHDRPTVTELVNNIINTQQSMGQYRNSPLSFKELETVKEVIVNKILDIYHNRIEYPKE